jgi:hypothetical protein
MARGDYQSDQDDAQCVVVALDFDGVLHPEPCSQENVLCRLPFVEDVLRDYLEHIEIIMSSRWRMHYSIEDLRAMFSPDIAARIVGVTPSIKRPYQKAICKLVAWLSART